MELGQLHPSYPLSEMVNRDSSGNQDLKQSDLKWILVLARQRSLEKLVPEIMALL
jgi:hypothetical protein